jgi:hypothetical protein
MVRGRKNVLFISFLSKHHLHFYLKQKISTKIYIKSTQKRKKKLLFYISCLLYLWCSVEVQGAALELGQTSIKQSISTSTCCGFDSYYNGQHLLFLIRKINNSTPKRGVHTHPLRGYNLFLFLCSLLFVSKRRFNVLCTRKRYVI